MSPKIITVAGQKGGVAKTTVLIALAVEWHQRGRRVLVIDADDPKQRSASVWSEVAAERGNDAPPVVRVGDDLSAQLHRLARGYDLVLIDTPGHLTGRVAYALGQSHLALLPCSASGLEVWGMSMATAPAVRDVCSVTRLDVCIVVTRVRKDTARGREIAVTLAGTGFDVCNSYLERRNAYDDSITTGKGPTTWTLDEKAADQTRALADEIEQRLGIAKGTRRAARAGKKQPSPAADTRAGGAPAAAQRRGRAARKGNRPAKGA